MCFKFLVRWDYPYLYRTVKIDSGIIIRRGQNSSLDPHHSCWVKTMFKHQFEHYVDTSPMIQPTGRSHKDKSWKFFKTLNMSVSLTSRSVEEANFHLTVSAEDALTNTKQFLPCSPSACLPYCTCLSQSLLISNLHNLQNHLLHPSYGKAHIQSNLSTAIL